MIRIAIINLTYIYSGHDPGVCCRNIFRNDALAPRLFRPGPCPLPRGHGVGRTECLILSRMALAQLNCSYVHLFRREPDRGTPKGGQMDRVIKGIRPVATMMADGRFQLGWALAEEGHVAEGVREMREAIAAIAATGTAIGMQYLSLCPRACLRGVWMRRARD